MRNLVRPLRAALKTTIKTGIDNVLVDYHVPGKGDAALLTFDDGPHPENTPKVLDMLDEAGVQAVFFVIGERAEKHPRLLTEIARRGHVLGNHTFTHLNGLEGGRYSTARCISDIERCRALIHDHTGQRTWLFRPPRGEINRKTLVAAWRTGHRLMHWSLEGGEWGRRADWTAEAIRDHVMEHLGRKDILLLHDDNPKTLTVLSALLAEAGPRDISLVRDLPGWRAGLQP